jgi:hypothetical protein
MYVDAIPSAIGPQGEGIQKGPGTTFRRPVSRCGRMALRYDIVVMIAKEPTKALKAVAEPM